MWPRFNSQMQGPPENHFCEWNFLGKYQTVLSFLFSSQPDGTNLYSFVYGYTSWEDYLDDMAKDGTWGDQMILFAAASNYGCVVHVISSVPNYEDVIISPPVHDAVELVLGHIFEQHYVSLLPIMSGKTRVCATP